MDTVGARQASTEIQAIKDAAPRIAQRIVGRAIQLFDGAGVSGDTTLAELFATAGTLRIADGPDEVHLASLGGTETAGRARG